VDRLRGCCRHRDNRRHVTAGCRDIVAFWVRLTLAAASFILHSFTVRFELRCRCTNAHRCEPAPDDRVFDVGGGIGGIDKGPQPHPQRGDAEDTSREQFALGTVGRCRSGSSCFESLSRMMLLQVKSNGDSEWSIPVRLKHASRVIEVACGGVALQMHYHAPSAD
jgi:hypothetical protein